MGQTPFSIDSQRSTERLHHRHRLLVSFVFISLLPVLAARAYCHGQTTLLQCQGEEVTKKNKNGGGGRRRGVGMRGLVL